MFRELVDSYMVKQPWQLNAISSGMSMGRAEVGEQDAQVCLRSPKHELILIDSNCRPREFIS